jgi:glycosyltransferase involved in cell wall biosynthesis
MRVLIVNDFFQKGGAEVQALWEKDLFKEKGISCMLLTFDPSFPDGWIDKDTFNIKRKDGRVSKFFYKLIPFFPFYKKIKKILSLFFPDVIHLENCLKITPSLFKALNGTKARIIQTIHDYGIVCPITSYCVRNDDWTECNGYFNIKKCNCRYRGFLWRWLKIHEVKTQKKHIEKFHISLISPSCNLTNKLRENGLIAVTIENQFRISTTNADRFFQPKLFLFVGNISLQKGLFPLLEATKEITSECSLLIIGGVANNIKEMFFNSIKLMPNVHYLGLLSHNQVINKMGFCSCLIVPSLWLENYPNVILEAFGEKLIVIGSSRGGIAEMINNNKLTFNPLDKKDIIEKIRFVNSLTIAGREEIISNNLRYIENHNSKNRYYNSLLRVIKNESNNIN